MAPPPETPTPRRFVIPKKHSGTGLPPRPSQQQQHHETPKSSLPLPPIVHTAYSSSQVGHPQFNATPRFSLHSTPRPPRASQQAPQHQQTLPGPPSTPAAPPGSAYFRSSRIKNVAQSGFRDEDVIDSSPPHGNFEVEDLDGCGEPGHNEDQDGLPMLTAAIGAHLRRRSQDDEVDWIVTDSSPPIGDDDGDGGSAIKHHREEVEPISVMGYGDGSVSNDDIIGARLSKRRRVSISSLPPFDSERDEGMIRLSSLPPDFVGLVESDHEDEDGHPVAAISIDEMVQQQEDERMNVPLDSTDRDPLNHPAGTNTRIEEDHGQTLEEQAQQHHSKQQRQQPAFHKAPRFKQQYDLQRSNTERHYDPLPEAFSPSRRQNKNANRYVPGGLASELRDWLVDMEAGTGPKRENEWLARIVVDDVPESAGLSIKSTGMQLVYGHHQATDPNNNEEDMYHEGDDVHMSNNHESIQAQFQGGQEAGAKSAVMIVLAGDGRVTPGIAKRRQVKRGVVVGIARPTWEITLGDLGRWAVACDWAILD